MASNRKRKYIGYYDYNLLACIILLTCFGLVMLYSTSAYTAKVNYGSDMKFFRQQTFVSIFGLFVVIAGSKMFSYRVYAKFAGIIYLAAIVLLVLTTTKLGVEVNGAKRWIRILGIQFQTAEVAKIALILFIPVLIEKLGKNLKGWKAPFFLLVVGAVPSVMAWRLTNNLSTAIILAGMTVAMLFVVHPQGKKFVLPGIILIIAVIVGVRYLAGQMISNIDQIDSFRWRRILVWMAPEQFSSEGGYQIMQALYALGSGGFFGKGLGNSAQKLGSVPEAQNDMIFAIICEELGVFGAGILTLLFAFMLYRLLFIAQNAPDLLGSLIVTGIFAHISLQVILNIAVVINLIPTTGITLPFVSYGGTSVLFLMAEMALALNVSSQIKIEDDFY